jgi:hypothetical protein
MGALRPELLPLVTVVRVETRKTVSVEMFQTPKQFTGQLVLFFF